MAQVMKDMRGASMKFCSDKLSAWSARDSATKLHWYPRLEVRPICNLLALIYFAGPIDNGSHVRDVGQLALKSRAE